MPDNSAAPAHFGGGPRALRPVPAAGAASVWAVVPAFPETAADPSLGTLESLRQLGDGPSLLVKLARFDDVVHRAPASDSGCDWCGEYRSVVYCGAGTAGVVGGGVMPSHFLGWVERLPVCPLGGHPGGGRTFLLMVSSMGCRGNFPFCRRWIAWSCLERRAGARVLDTARHGFRIVRRR